MNLDVGTEIQESDGQLSASLEAFSADALAGGCDKSLVCEWQANAALQTHTHPFDGEVIVVQGKIWRRVVAVGASGSVALFLR